MGLINGPGDANNQVYETRRNAGWEASRLVNNGLNSAIDTARTQSDMATQAFQPWGQLTPQVTQSLTNELNTNAGSNNYLNYLNRTQGDRLSANIQGRGLGRSTYAVNQVANLSSDIAAKTYQDRMNLLMQLNKDSVNMAGKTSDIQANLGDTIASAQVQQGKFNADMEQYMAGIKNEQDAANNPMGTIGTIGGALIGSLLGGPAGATLGAQLGGMIGGSKPSGTIDYSKMDLSSLLHWGKPSGEGTSTQGTVSPSSLPPTTDMSTDTGNATYGTSSGNDLSARYQNNLPSLQSNAFPRRRKLW